MISKAMIFALVFNLAVGHRAFAAPATDRHLNATEIRNGAAKLVMPASGTATVPAGTQTLATQAGAETLTNKTISGASNTLSNVSLTSQVTGTLPVANGGSGAATLAQYGVLLGNGTSAVQALAPDSSTTKVLTSGGASANPSWQAVASAPDSSYEISNLGLAASVAGNALTVALKQANGSDASSGASAVKIGFRNSTATTGQYTQRSVTGALSVVVSSGSTLGHSSAVNQYVYVYAIDNAGTVELAVAGSRLADEGALISTTADGGAGAADSKTTFYSTTARSNVAVRLIGRMKSSQTTAGTWATAISEVSLTPFWEPIPRSSVVCHTTNGEGSTGTGVRQWTTCTTVGPNVTRTADATNGDYFTINADGVYTACYVDQFNAAGWLGITLNASGADQATDIYLVTAANILVIAKTMGADGPEQVCWTEYFPAGSKLRAQMEPSRADGASTARARFSVSQVSN